MEDVFYDIDIIEAEKIININEETRTHERFQKVNNNNNTDCISRRLYGFLR
jgi:hypothetical protein